MEIKTFTSSLFGRSGLLGKLRASVSSRPFVGRVSSRPSEIGLMKAIGSEISLVIGHCETVPKLYPKLAPAHFMLKAGGKRDFHVKVMTHPSDHNSVLTRVSSVDGGWDEWSEWTACSAQCDRQRWRECTAPAPRNHGRACEGKGHDVENCTGGLCTQGKAYLEVVIITIISVCFIV